MRIDELLANQRPVFSVEFFPPKTEEGLELLFETVAALKPLQPDYVSVTYGAGGATRDGTVEISERIKREHGLEVMAHLSCVGETREGLASILERFAEIGIDNVLALRGDPPRGRGELHAPRRRPLLGGGARPGSSASATVSRSAAPAFPRSTRRPTTSPPTSPT